MIQVVNRAFDILEYIARNADKPRSLGEIAGELNLNAGTCANILKTMVDRNYIQKLDKQKGYVLGSMAEGFTGYEAQTKKLIDAAMGEMQRLTKQVNENSVLGVLRNDKRIVLLRAHGKHDLQANTATEKRAYTSSTGRLLVAMLGNNTESFLAKYGLPTTEEWPEAVHAKSFRKQVAQIRKAGYAVQVTKGQIIGFAVPVYNGDSVAASISVYMPIARYNKEPNPLLKLLNETAKRIEKELE